MEDEDVQHVEKKTCPRLAHEHEQSGFLPNNVSLLIPSGLAAPHSLNQALAPSLTEKRC